MRLEWSETLSEKPVPLIIFIILRLEWSETLSEKPAPLIIFIGNTLLPKALITFFLTSKILNKFLRLSFFCYFFFGFFSFTCFLKFKISTAIIISFFCSNSTVINIFTKKAYCSKILKIICIFIRFII